MGTNASHVQRPVQPRVVSTTNTPSPAPVQRSQPSSTPNTSSAPSSSPSPSYTPSVTYSEPVVITYSVTKTNYFNNVNLDQLHQVCMNILQKLRNYALVYSIVGLWEAACANKLQKELNKMHTYLEILCATLQGFTNVIEQGQKIKSLQSQVDSYCTDLTSYDNYVAANNLISQINSLMGNINPSLSAMQTQAILPASVNETFTSPVADRYRFCYNAVLGVANQARSDREAIVGYYQSFCNLEASVKNDSYIYSGWNIVVQIFDKFIKKSDKIANWWTNYFANVRSLEQKLPDSEFNVSETTVEAYGRDHENFSIPSFDAYRSANQGESLSFNIPSRSSGTSVGGSMPNGGNRTSPNSANRTSYSYGTNNSSSGNGYTYSNTNTSSGSNYTYTNTPSGSSYTYVNTPSGGNYTHTNTPSGGSYTYTNVSTSNNPSYSGFTRSVGTNYSNSPNIPRGESEIINKTMSGPNIPMNNTTPDQDVVHIDIITEQQPAPGAAINQIYCRLNDQNHTLLTRSEFNQYNRDYNLAMTTLRSNYPNIADSIETGSVSIADLSDWATNTLNGTTTPQGVEIQGLNDRLSELQTTIQNETAEAERIENNHLWSLGDWQQECNDHLNAATQAQREAQSVQARINVLNNIIEHGHEMQLCSNSGYTLINND